VTLFPQIQRMRKNSDNSPFGLKIVFSDRHL